MAAKVKLVKEPVTEETEIKHAGHVAAASTRPAAKKAKVTVPGSVTLAIDIGGTGLKAAVLDAKGNMLTERVRIDTPAECTPALLVSSLHTLVDPLPHFDRVSVGFPGVVRNGVIKTAPNLGTPVFKGFDIGAALEKAFGCPVRVLNDADVQGYAAIHGKGVEMVITLGTGFGTSIFHDGEIAPHLEISQHPFRKGETYDQQLGQEARKKIGNKKWQKRVRRAIDTLRTLVNFDHLYIGGGNAKHLEGELPADVSLVDNSAGILGGIRLWDRA
jgi:polyphosphate glucokinase